MSIYSEREALREQLSHIREEKNELRKLYREMQVELYDRETYLLSRIRELDERDINLSDTPGIYDVQGLINDLSTTIVQLKELVPQVPIKVLLDEIRRESSSGNSPVLVEESKTGVLGNPEFRKEVVDSVARENRNLGVKATERDKKDSKGIGIKFSGKKAAPIVRDYLDKAGKPVSLKILTRVLEDYGFEKTINGTERLKSIMKAEPKIKVASRGYYQFVK